MLWNDRQYRGPALQRVLGMVLEVWPDYTQPYRNKDWAAALCSTGDFHDVQTDRGEQVDVLPRPRFLDLGRSINRIRTAIGLDAHDQLVQRIDAALRDEGIDTVEMPYVCNAWTAWAT